MMNMLKGAIVFFTFLLSVTAFAQKPEFRGVWVATVNNIDWPSKPTISSDIQKAEFIKLADMHKANGMNALVVQIRPATDAYYPSPYEPWSQWLTGKQGLPPFPYYDPLKFMIKETHKRGMEFHAWMNPYRAVFNVNKAELSPTHITRLHPEWFLRYGDTKYFDPGNKDAQNYVVKVVEDVVSRYDIDAIHFDDYFYPYKIAGKEFPDAAGYAKYGAGLSKDAWRRSNTDSIILKLSKAIKRIKPKCQFGISPFGVWRNAEVDSNGSNTKAGQTNYDDLYADILLWLRKNWIDYVAPQIYWEIGHPLAEFNTLVDWWDKNSYGKNCYIGIGIYRAGNSPAWKDKTQLPRQILKVRSAKNVDGFIFFSSKNFEKNPNGWSDSLRLNYFKEPAPLPKIK